jgi:hypothetical protein
MPRGAWKVIFEVGTLWRTNVTCEVVVQDAGSIEENPILTAKSPFRVHRIHWNGREIRRRFYFLEFLGNVSAVSRSRAVKTGERRRRDN